MNFFSVITEDELCDLTDQLVMQLLHNPVTPVAAWVLVWLVPLAILARILYDVLTLPLRRQERARLFLHLIETGLARGQGVTQTLVEASRHTDRGLPARFHLLAAYLKEGLRLGEALDRVPRLLPPQITAMLKVGEELGDLRRVLPACQRLLKDGVSQASGAQNYVPLLGLPPIAPVVMSIVMVWVVPKLSEIFKDMAPDVPLPALTSLVVDGFSVFVLVPVATFAAVHLLAFCYAGGPRLRHWLGRPLNRLLDGLLWRLPWRRKRMQRDFAAMLALLLDSGVPEQRALQLAAACTCSEVFMRRAKAAQQDLQAGASLPEAVARLDDAGEFRWRLLNARHGPGGFMAALSGWLETLDAKAWQQEQAAAQIVTTAMLVCNGFFVGMFAIAMFLPLIKLSDSIW